MKRRELLKGLLALPLLALPFKDRFAGMGLRTCGTETGRMSYIVYEGLRLQDFGHQHTPAIHRGIYTVGRTQA